MVLYATVIPYNSVDQDKDHYDISQETLKIIINIVEVIMIAYSLKVRNSFSEKESHLKVLTVGIAWASADSIASNLLYFLMNATGEEFKWDYIQSAIQSNLDLFNLISIVALVECYEVLKSKQKFNVHIIMILLFKYFFNGLGYKHIKALNFDDSWYQLAAKGVACLVFAIFAK